MHAGVGGGRQAGGGRSCKVRRTVFLMVFLMVCLWYFLWCVYGMFFMFMYFSNAWRQKATGNALKTTENAGRSA